jgi:hypothetical protein
MIKLPNSLDISDTSLTTSLSRVYEYALEILAHPIDIYFTDHTIEHSQRILTLIGKLLDLNSKNIVLNDTEKYVLVSSFFLHDIGMQYESIEYHPDARRQTHHLISKDIVRKEFKEIGLIRDYVDIISSVIEGHRGDIEPEKHAPQSFGTCLTVRSDLLAALLYLGDELDITYERVDISKRKRLRYSDYSSVHFFKHLYVQAVDIDDDRCIKIVFRFPPGRKDQYDLLFRRLVCKKLHSCIEDITPILQDKYDVVVAFRDKDIKVVDSSTVELMPVDIYNLAYGESHGIRNFQFIDKLGFESLKGLHRPDVFYKGYVSWTDIVNDLDITRDCQENCLSQLSEALAFSSEKRCFSGCLITGGGGSGKSTFLMRIAYNLLNSDFSKFNHLLWFPYANQFHINELRNLYYSDPKPILLFVDGITIDNTVMCLLEAQRANIPFDFPLIIIFAARHNEWLNAYGNKLQFGTFREIRLDKLSDKEIHLLLDKLDQYNELHDLQPLSPSERFSKLKLKSDGELLVAMLNATHGIGFIGIVENEYRNLRKDYPEAAKAYEFICFFFIYDVLIPKDLLITLTDCYDENDLETKVLQHSSLVILKHPMCNFGDFYRPRHKEIAEIVIGSIDEYKTEVGRLRRIGVIIRKIDNRLRHHRYVIIDILTNFVTRIFKAKPQAEFDDRIEEVKSFLKEIGDRIDLLIESVKDIKHFGELVRWSKLLSQVRAKRLNIFSLKRMVELKKYDRKANYRLALLLSRTADAANRCEEIAGYYRASFLGGNREIQYLFEYLQFCLKYGLTSHIDPLITDFERFYSFTPAEDDLRHKLTALVSAYRIKKDTSILIRGFTEINAHLEASSQLKPYDELMYIDTVELKNPQEAFKKYTTFLATIHPNRPRAVLLRIAHCASRIKGEEKFALQFYSEVYTSFIKPNPISADFPIIIEYARFCIQKDLADKHTVYDLLSTCKRLCPSDIKVYLEFARYAKKKGDSPIAKGVAAEGLKAMTVFSKFDQFFLNELKGFQ